MKYKIDLHIHTNANPHAYSTLEENVNSAKRKGMEIIAITNHGPALQDSPHWWSLANFSVFPEYIHGLRVLKGVEANITGEEGELDINQRVYDVMDIVIAGFHAIPQYGHTSDRDRNTRAIVNLIKSQKVDVLVHTGNPQFPLHYEEMVKCASEHNVAIELNNSSLKSSRKGSAPNCNKIAELAREYGCWISLGSDSHISLDIGAFQEVQEIIERLDYPEHLIINSSPEILFDFLKLRKELSPEKIEN